VNFYLFKAKRDEWSIASCMHWQSGDLSSWWGGRTYHYHGNDQKMECDSTTLIFICIHVSERSLSYLITPVLLTRTHTFTPIQLATVKMISNQSLERVNWGYAHSHMKKMSKQTLWQPHVNWFKRHSMASKIDGQSGIQHEEMWNISQRQPLQIVILS